MILRGISIFCVFLTLLVAGPLAHGLELKVWQPAGYDFSFVIPVRDGETPAQAVENYLTTLESKPDMKSYARTFREHVKSSTFADLPVNSEKVMALGMTTTIKPDALNDHVPQPAKMHRLMDPVTSRGAVGYVYPAGSTLGLNEAERAEFQKLLATKFDLLLSPGGYDIDPTQYGHPNTKSEGVRPNLDEDQVRILRSYMKDSHGFYFGICRGAQAGAVAQGCPLIQHLPDEVGTTVRHGANATNSDPGTHRVRKLKVPRNSPTARVFGSDKEFTTTQSIHHQAANPKLKSKGVRITAISPEDKVVEMMEYLDERRNIKGMGAQYHPERDTNDVKNRVYSVVYEEAEKARDRRLGRAGPLRGHPKPYNSCALNFSSL